MLVNRKTTMGATLLFMCIALAGCGSSAGPAPENETGDFGWSTVRSPETGRCYEVLSHQTSSGNLGHGYMGMAEIPCEDI